MPACPATLASPACAACKPAAAHKGVQLLAWTSLHSGMPREGLLAMLLLPSQPTGAQSADEAGPKLSRAFALSLSRTLRVTMQAICAQPAQIQASSTEGRTWQARQCAAAAHRHLLLVPRQRSAAPAASRTAPSQPPALAQQLRDTQVLVPAQTSTPQKTGRRARALTPADKRRNDRYALGIARTGKPLPVPGGQSSQLQRQGRGS